MNGEYALTFESCIGQDKIWQEGGYSLFFKFKTYNAGNSGVYFFSVPEDKIKAGEKCTLKATHVSGGPKSWFMVLNYDDVIGFEGVESDGIPVTVDKLKDNKRAEKNDCG